LEDCINLIGAKKCGKVFFIAAAASREKISTVF
jgi:hypothetical protein